MLLHHPWTDHRSTAQYSDGYRQAPRLSIEPIAYDARSYFA
jgi:hypothetical protein